jgi:ribonuclease P protein component
MLPKAHRLHGDAAFKALARQGRPFFGRSLTVRVVPQGADRSNPTKVAFVVSTKVSKKATERNLLKRRLREIVRPSLPRLKSGLHVLVITKQQATRLTYGELQQEVEDVFAKARLWLS